MTLALIILVGTVGVLLTVSFAVLGWRASRRGASRELVLGYLALMVVVSALSLFLLRLL